MVTVILPGGSAKNKDWVLEASKNLNLGHDVRPIFWNNWDDPEKGFDPKDKAGDVVDIIHKESANVVAKSIGTLVASYVFQQIAPDIQKVILCGIPLHDLNDKDKEELKNGLNMISPDKIICFQNDNDPHASFEEAKAFLQNINSAIKVVAKVGDHHNYPYYSDFENFLKA